MNEQLIEAIRQLNLKPGESYTVEVDGQTVEVRRAGDEPVGPSPDPPGTAQRFVLMRGIESPGPYKFDENDIAPGNLGDDHDFPLPGP